MNLLREYIRKLLVEQNENFLYRSSPEEYVQNLLRDGSIRSRGKDFVSISTDPDSGSMDDYGSVTMKLDRNKILAAGGIEIVYDDPDFWNEFPDIAKHVTGYAGEEDYINRGGDEEFGMDFDEMVMDYEQEAEVVIPELPADAIVSVYSEEPLGQDTLDMLAKRGITVEQKGVMQEGSRIVPASMSMKAWDSYKKKHKISAKQYDKDHKTKWKITHGPGHKDAGKTIKGNTGLTYAKAKSIQNAFGGW